MPLIDNTPQDVTPAERLAKEARTRLSELTSSMLLAYGNLMNYQHNNGAGVSADDYMKAHGKDAKDYKYIVGQMRRMLLRMNPDLKARLDEMVPRKTTKGSA